MYSNTRLDSGINIHKNNGNYAYNYLTTTNTTFGSVENRTIYRRNLLATHDAASYALNYSTETDVNFSTLYNKAHVCIAEIVVTD